MNIRSITITGDSMSGSPEVADLFNKNNNLIVKDLSKIVKDSKCELSKIEEETGRIIEKSEIDKNIDKNLVELRDKGVVIEAKMAWLLLPDSFKVRIKLSRRESAIRYIRKSNLVENEETINSVMNRLRKKVRNECKRFKALYGMDYRDDSMYDLIINGDNKTSEELYDEILNAYNEFNSAYVDSGTCSCLALYPSGIVEEPKGINGLLGIDNDVMDKCSNMSDIELFNEIIPVLKINNDYYVVGKYEVYYEQLLRTVTDLDSSEDKLPNYKSCYQIVDRGDLPENIRNHSIDLVAVCDVQEGLLFNYPVLPFGYYIDSSKVGNSVGL